MAGEEQILVGDDEIDITIDGPVNQRELLGLRVSALTVISLASPHFKSLLRSISKPRYP